MCKRAEGDGGVGVVEVGGVCLAAEVSVRVGAQAACGGRSRINPPKPNTPLELEHSKGTLCPGLNTFAPKYPSFRFTDFKL